MVGHYIGPDKGNIKPKWKGLEQQQNWGMNIKVMGRKEPKVRMIGALPFDANVVDSILATDIVRAKEDTQGFVNMEVPYMANTDLEDMQEIIGKIMLII